MEAAFIASKINALMFIIRTLIIIVHIYYTVLTTNIATNKVSCLLYFRTQCQQYTQCVYNWCLQSLQIHTKLTHKSANSNIHSYFTEICQACRPYYLLTPWSRVLLEKLTGLQVVNKFPAFYGTRRFVTAFTSARHLSLSSASLIQSTLPHPTS